MPPEMTIAHMVFIRRRSFIRIYWGISPPEKNMVNIKTQVSTGLPYSFFRDSG